MATPTETYTAITTTELQAGKPIRSDQGLRFRANLLASLQGATGAQRVYIGAWERLNTGSTQRLIDTTEYTQSTNAYSIALSFMMMQAGTATFEWSTKVGSNSGENVTSRLRRTRQTGSFNFGLTTHGSTSYVATTVDVSVEPGDIIYFQWKRDAASGDAYIKDIKVLTGGADLIPSEGMAALINANSGYT